MKKRIKKVGEFEVSHVYRRKNSIYFIAGFPSRWSVVLKTDFPQEGDPHRLKMWIWTLRKMIRRGAIEDYNKQFYGDNKDPLPIIPEN